MFCKNCGSQIKDGEKFCTKCGIKVDNLNNNMSPTRRKYRMYILICFLIVIIIVVCFACKNNVLSIVMEKVTQEDINGYFLTDDNATEASPIYEIDEKQLEETLNGETIIVGDRNLIVDETNCENIKIINQDIDFEAGTDVLEVSFTVQDEYIIWSINADIDCKFVEHTSKWMVSSIEVTSTDYTIGSEWDFVKTDQELCNDLLKRSIIIMEQYEKQTITFDSTDIKNFIVEESEFDIENYKQNVKCSFDIERTLANFHVDAYLIYSYNKSDWRLDSISTTAEITVLKLIGEWEGYYTHGDEKPSMSLLIDSYDGKNSVSAVYIFGPSKEEPNYESGSFEMIGELHDTLGISLIGTKWIERPDSSWIIWNIEGSINLEDEKMTGYWDNGDYFEIKLKKNTYE